MKAKTEVQTTNQEQTALTLSQDKDLMALLAAEAKEAAALERPAVSNISLRAGMVSIDGEAVKGNKLEGVVVAASFVNTLYSKPFDPDTPASPDCFAISKDGEAMMPDPSIDNPQSASCATCAFAQWGSDVKDGKPSKGKRCKESRRLVFLPKSALDSVEDVKNAELAQVKLPVTSVRAWGGFVNTLAVTLQLPYYAVVSELTTKPDLKTQFKVVITPVARIEDTGILRAILTKREEAMRIAMLPFDTTPQGEEVAPETATQKF